MIVWVNSQIFADASAREVDRLALLRNAARRQHTLMISEGPTIAAQRSPSGAFGGWLDTLTDTLRWEVAHLHEQLQHVTPMAVTRGTERILVSNTELDASHSGCRLNLREAVRIVGLPIFMLVENIVNDAAFLRRAMPPRWAVRIEQWERAGMLRFEHGGGSSLPQIVKHFSQDEACRRSFGLPAAAWWAVHLVLSDHDGDGAGNPGTLARQTYRACRSAGMESRMHRLERRTADHYLPKEAVLEVVRLKLTSENDRQLLEQLVEAHFNATPPIRHFAAQLPKLGDKDFLKNRFNEPLNWSERWFRDDDAWPELTRIAEKIAAAM